MHKAIPCLVAVLTLMVSDAIPAQVRPSAGDFDLVAQRLDANGLMFNPRWRTLTPPRVLDPAKQCGILAVHGTPGYRTVLLRDPDCFGDEQRSIIRLNEPRRLVAEGVACGQAVNDGSPQGHLNWIPVTMEGVIIFDKKMRLGGDFDMTFEFVSDDPAPSTKWNGGDDLWDSLPPRRSPVHLEFDYRETTDRLSPAVRSSWWTSFAAVADTAERANEMLGIGRAVVTGLFNLDLVHFGHSEIHPVFGLAVLVRADTVSPTRIRHHWVFLARDRGNQGNCATRGAMPFRLRDSTDGLNRYRFRLATPDGASAAPTIAKADSWIGTSNTRMVGPEFKWSPSEGLQVEVGWPRPSRESPDAVMLGDLIVEWSGNFADTLAVGRLTRAVAQARALRTMNVDLMGPEYYRRASKKPFDVDDYYYSHFGAIETWDGWSPVVMQVSVLPSAAELPLVPAEIFDRFPPVLSCSQVKDSENPRCLGHWSVAPVAGVDPGDPPGERNLEIGVSLENARHYLGGPVLRFRYQLGYLWHERLAGDGAPRSEHMISVQPALIAGPIRKWVTLYLIVSPGFGVSRTDSWGASLLGAVGAGMPIRTGYQIGINVELMRMFRTWRPDYWALSLRVPITAF